MNLLSNNTAGNSKMSNIILKLKAVKKLRIELKISCHIMLGCIHYIHLPFQLHKFIQKKRNVQGFFWYLKLSYEGLDTSVQVPK